MERLRHGPAKGALVLGRRADSPNYHCEYTGRDGRTHRHPLRTPDKQVAVLKLRRLQLVEADPHQAANHAKLEEVLTAYLDDCDSRVARGDLARDTAGMNTRHARHLLRVVGGDTPMSDLTLAVLQDYVETREGEGAAPRTVSKELSSIRGVLKVARKQGWFTQAVEAVVPDYSAAYEPRERWLSREEAWRLVRSYEQRLPGRAAFVAFVLGTGARFAEALAARPGDYDAAARRVRLRGTKTDEAARVLPVTGGMRELLDYAAEHSDGDECLMFRPWGSVRRDLAVAAARVSLETNLGDEGKVETCSMVDADGRPARRPEPHAVLEAGGRIVGAPTPNDLRRSYCAWLVEDGLSHEVVARMMGHSSTAMVSRVYGRSRPQALEAQIDAHYARREKAG